MRLFVTLALSIVALGCAAHRAPPPPAPRPSCLKARGGCPAPAPAPVCASDIVPQPLAELLQNARDLVGQDVTVRGPVVVGEGSCTLLGCGNSCCNRCARPFQLGVAPPNADYRSARAGTVQVNGPAVTCVGDESLQCCPVDAHGQELIVTGKLRLVGVTWLIEEAQVCAAP